MGEEKIFLDNILSDSQVDTVYDNYIFVYG